eukprot:scaffold57779_cov30-Tisochrysis_lutea.AAC.2
MQAPLAYKNDGRRAHRAVCRGRTTAHDRRGRQRENREQHGRGCIAGEMHHEMLPQKTKAVRSGPQQAAAAAASLLA